MTDNVSKKEARPIPLLSYALGAVVLWSTLLALSLAWNIQTEKLGILELARIQARAAFEKDVMYRRWNVDHGGIYAPVTERTQPNPYLDVAERDITTPLGKKLTLINPAYMTRQVHELEMKEYGVKSHITSLNPTRPENMADIWENRALKAFDKGIEEISSVEKIDDKEYMRLMHPLITEKGCIKCHGAQGYEVGDVLGGISISIPMAPIMAISKLKLFTLLTGHGLLLLFGLIVIWVGTRHLKQQIHKRIGLEDALLKSEVKYRAMMESMNDPVYICSSDLRVEYMNPAMIRTIGYDATGEYCFKALLGLDEKCPSCKNNMVKQGDCFETDIVIPKNNRFYHVSHSPIVREDGSVSKLTVYRDTTDIKKMEAQLQQARKMEAIGTLAGGIAHDFNNILFPIIGHAEMLLDDVPENSPLHNSLDEIYTSAMRAKNLVKQILTFSRQNGNELKLMKVQPLIKEALKLIRSTIPTTIDIKYDIQDDCGVIKADSTQIYQIVMNLTTNAYHAMESTGGELKVSLKEVEFSEYDVISPDMEPGSYVCLTVADTGMGMDKDVAEKIFDPFFTTKEQGRGIGMGLSVVHGIVRRMGGSIQVHSEPGKGTQFHVYLPVAKNASEQQGTKTKETIQGGTGRILLVDDEDSIITMETQRLERLGYQVTPHTSSIEALETFRAGPDKFDLVITDMAMPNMSGDKLSLELIRIRPDIPILLCTGFSETMPEEKAVALGIKGFLLKPIVMKDLAQKIREILDK